MHMCKAMRHKKHHFAFLTAEGKEENPERVFCYPAAGQCDPINPGSLHKGVSIEEKNLSSLILAGTKAPGFARDIRHPAALAARASSENPFCTLSGGNLAPAANLLFPHPPP